MAYQTTSVPEARTQSQIKKLLVIHGAYNIAFVSTTNPERMEGLRATIMLADEAYGIKIAVPIRERTTERDQEQEIRRVWRVLFYHLKDIFVAADSGVIDIRTLLLPYFVTKGGRTIAEHILGGGDLPKALESPRNLLQ